MPQATIEAQQAAYRVPHSFELLLVLPVAETQQFETKCKGMMMTNEVALSASLAAVTCCSNNMQDDVLERKAQRRRTKGTHIKQLPIFGFGPPVGSNEEVCDQVDKAFKPESRECQQPLCYQFINTLQTAGVSREVNTNLRLVSMPDFVSPDNPSILTA